MTCSAYLLSISLNYKHVEGFICEYQTVLSNKHYSVSMCGETSTVLKIQLYFLGSESLNRVPKNFFSLTIIYDFSTPG